MLLSSVYCSLVGLPQDSSDASTPDRRYIHSGWRTNQPKGTCWVRDGLMGSMQAARLIYFGLLLGRHPWLLHAKVVHTTYLRLNIIPPCNKYAFIRVFQQTLQTMPNRSTPHQIPYSCRHYRGLENRKPPEGQL